MNNARLPAAGSLLRGALQGFVALAALGCGEDGASSSGAGGGSPQVCVAGQQVECPCPGGALGAQACRADGSGFEACTCDGATSSASGPAGGGSTGETASSASSTAGGSGGGGGSTGGAGGAGGGQGGSEIGSPQVIASQQGTIVEISTDSEAVYWAGSTAGNIVRMPKSGGTPTVIASGQKTPGYLALDSFNVYWSTLDESGGAATSTIMSAPKGGGAHSIVSSASGRGLGLATDGALVYWSARDSQDEAMNGLLKAPVGGGPFETIVQSGGAGGTLRVDAAHLYWMMGNSLRKFQLPASGPGIGLGTFPNGGRTALAHSVVYVATPPSIYIAPKDGSGSSLFVDGQTDVRGLVADEEHVYWCDFGADKVLRRHHAGGAIELVAEASDPFVVAVDSTHIYWNSASEGNVYRASK